MDNYWPYDPSFRKASEILKVLLKFYCRRKKLGKQLKERVKVKAIEAEERHSSEAPVPEGIRKLELEFQRVIEPKVTQKGRWCAGRYNWPRSMPEDYQERANELVQGFWVDIFGRIHECERIRPVIFPAFVNDIFRARYTKEWRIEKRLVPWPETEEEENRLVTTPDSKESGLDVTGENKEYEIPQEYDHIPTKLQLLHWLFFREIEKKYHRRIHRRTLVVLLHTPFITFGERPQGSFISHQQLAGLLHVAPPRISEYLDELVGSLGLWNGREPRDWSYATLIATFVELSGSSAAFLIDPTPTPEEHEDLINVLWAILRLIQVNNLEERVRLFDEQGDASDITYVVGKYLLFLSVSLDLLGKTPFWAGGKVSIREIRVQ